MQPLLRVLFLLHLALWPVISGAWFVFQPETDPLHRYALRYIAVAAVVPILFLAMLTGPRSGSELAPPGRWHLFGIGTVLVAFAYSTAFSAPNPSYAILRFCLVSFIITGGVAAFVWLRELGEEGEEFMLKICASIVASMLIYTLFIPLLIPTYVERSGASWGNGFPPFFNIRQFSNYLAPSIALMLGLWVAASRIRISMLVLAYAALCILWAALFWSGGRAPVLALGFALMVGTAWTRSAERRRLIYGATSSALIGALLAQAPPRPSGSFGFTYRLADTARYDTLDRLSSLRTSLWSDALAYFLEHPVFGNGYAQLQFQDLKTVGEHSTAHFFLLDALHDFGLLGGGALIVLVFAGYLSLAQQFLGKLGPSAVGPFLALTVMLAQSNLDNTLYWYPTVLLAVLSFAMLAAIATAPTARKQKTP